MSPHQKLKQLFIGNVIFDQFIFGNRFQRIILQYGVQQDCVGRCSQLQVKELVMVGTRIVPFIKGL